MAGRDRDRGQSLRHLPSVYVNHIPLNMSKSALASLFGEIGPVQVIDSFKRTRVPS